MAAKYKRYEELLLDIERCIGGLPLSRQQQEHFAETAAWRDRDLREERRENRAEMREAVRSRDKGDVKLTALQWLRNERHIDALGFAMSRELYGREMSDAPLRKKLNKLNVGRKPAQLGDLAQDVEDAHPWSRKLANKLVDIEELLDRY